MKDGGCASASVGIESAHNKILKSMRKGVTIEQIEQIISYANEIGINMEGSLIFGDLEETMDTVSHTLNWWKENKKRIKSLHMILVFPGTYLYQVACEKGIIKDSVQFIKDYSSPGAPFVNVSKLADKEYFELQSLLLVLKNEKQCPHCQGIIEFEKFAFMKIEGRCSVCNTKMVLIPAEYYDSETLSKNIESLIKGKRTAIWEEISDEN
jgi:hypothetical protein